MKIRVIDFETTGTPEDETKAICEVGWTDLTDDWKVGTTYAYLVNPGHSIPPQTPIFEHYSSKTQRRRHRRWRSRARVRTCLSIPSTRRSLTWWATP